MIDEEGKQIDESESNEPAENNKIQPQKNKQKKSLIVLIAILIVVVLGAISFAAYSSIKSSTKKDEAEILPSQVPSVAVSISKTERIVDEGITWITPEKIDDQNVFLKSNSSESAYTSTDYYNVGKTSSGGTVILAVVNLEGLGTIQKFHRIIKNSDGYKRITQNSDEIDVVDYTQDYKLMQDDNSYIFKSLIPDKTIQEKDTILISSSAYQFVTDRSGIISERKVASTKWGDLNLAQYNSLSLKKINEDLSDDSPVINVSKYLVKLNDSTEVTYEPRPSFLLDDNTFDLTYTNQTAKTNKYLKIATGGCGMGFGSFPAISDKSLTNSTQSIGSKGSSNIYTISDKENLLIRYGYEVYQMDEGPNEKSIDDFISDVGLVFWTDAYGSSIAFLNTEFEPNVECGKPVIYLYPSQQTSFNVKVGAEITKSDPKYNKGWSGIAKPNGELILQGQSYPYLFWEGLGFGLYPEVKSGKIVASSKVKDQIEQDLKSMSLTEREISDFLDFWLSKMPQSKYTRLTWFTNQELDKLAPLSVSPKPDSTIRVFLDFAGLEKPYKISSQQLPRFERKGFTVVEWGGLLKGTN